MCQEKQCIKCLRFLPLGEFGKRKTGKDGLHSQCKECEKEYQRKYREANKEKVAGYERKYREANKEKIAERDRKYREANREKKLEYNRKYYEANKENIVEQKHKYRETKRQEKIQSAVFRGLDADKMKELKTKLAELEA